MLLLYQIPTFILAGTSLQSVKLFNLLNLLTAPKSIGYLIKSSGNSQLLCNFSGCHSELVTNNLEYFLTK